MTTENKTAEDILAELEAKQQAGYLFRGEPKEYKAVTSSLYRVTPPEALRIISRIEQDGVAACILHCYQEMKIQGWVAKGTLQALALQKLSEMQHYGGKTNLIDFTTCPHRALFFACDRWPEHDGRIVVIKSDLIPACDYVEPENQDALIPWGRT